MKKGKYALSCNDAKYFAVLAEAAVKDSGTLEEPSQSLINIVNAIGKLDRRVKELAASKGRVTSDKMQAAVHDGLEGLYKIVTEKQYGQAEESDFKEYMSVNFCGKKRWFSIKNNSVLRYFF